LICSDSLRVLLNVLSVLVVTSFFFQSHAMKLTTM
jgi:hypothetical protein